MATKRRSGPSGKNKGTAKMLRASDEQWVKWKKAADADSRTLSAWIRLACDRFARSGFEQAEMPVAFGADVR